MLPYFQDELLWGAAWLHKATKNPMYLNYIKVNGQILGAAEFDNTFGWDNKHVGARILLSKVQIPKPVFPFLFFYNACKCCFKLIFVLSISGLSG